jgi:hypothetical protein
MSFLPSQTIKTSVVAILVQLYAPFLSLQKQIYISLYSRKSGIAYINLKNYPLDYQPRLQVSGFLLWAPLLLDCTG